MKANYLSLPVTALDASLVTRIGQPQSVLRLEWLSRADCLDLLQTGINFRPAAGPMRRNYQEPA